jgi:hypothetical protein
MAFIDMFLSEEKLIAKHQRRLTNRDSQPEDREASARYLADKATPKSLLGLLARFDVALDHQLKDAGEKEFLYSLVVSVGDPIVDPLKVWLRKCKQFAMPLKVLEALAGRAEATNMALELLEIEFERDDFKPEKKKGLLIWLTEVRDPRLFGAATPFLSDFDEGVRYAAAEVLIAQRSDDVAPTLLAALVNPEEESNRLRVRIAEVFHQRGWTVEGLDADRVPVGYQLRGNKLGRA